MSLLLASGAFESRHRIPKRYTCDGPNLSPPLAWSGVPRSATALVLVCCDPDAPSGTFHHWAAYNISPETRGLEEGVRSGHGNCTFLEAINDFGRRGYSGPCPPHGHGPHHYHFRLSALETALAGLGQEISAAEIAGLARAREVAAAEIVGIYER